MTTLAVSPDGRYAAAVHESPQGRRPKVTLFDLSDGSLVSTFRLVQAPLKETATPQGQRLVPTASLITFTLDSRRLVTADQGGLVRIWDVSSGSETQRLEGHEGEVDAFACHPDGVRLISGSQDKSIRIWDLDSGRMLATLEGHTAGVTALRLAADGQHLLSGSADNALRVWSLPTGTCQGVLHGHTRAVTAIEWTPGDEHAISCSQDGSLRVWDWRQAGMSDGSRVAVHPSGVAALAFSADDHWGVSAGDQGDILIWEVATGKVSPQIQAPASVVALFHAGEPGQMQVFCKDGTFFNLDLRARSLQILGKTPPGAHKALAATPAGMRLFYQARTSIRILDPHSGRQVGELQPGDAVSAMWGLAATPDGSRVAAVSWGAVLEVWDGRSGVRLQRFKLPRPGLSLALTPDGGRVIAGLNNGELYDWDLTTGQLVASWRASLGWGATNWVRAVALAAAVPRAVSGANDGMIKLWDLNRHELIAGFRGESEINRCAISSDGRTVMAGGKSGRVHLLRLVEGVP
jgi:WD40 repeat protein